MELVKLSKEIWDRTKTFAQMLDDKNFNDHSIYPILSLILKPIKETNIKIIVCVC